MRVREAKETNEARHTPAASAGPAGPAIVLGGAECVWRDLEALESMIGRPWDGIVIAVNDIMCHWPRRLDHAVSLHPEKMKGWVEARSKNGHPGGYETWSSRKNGGVQRKIDGWAGGSSGLLGVAVAVELGCRRIVLCGIPMDKSPHFKQSTVHKRPGHPWNSADSHWKTWKKDDVKKKMRGIVRSMSGRTRDLLGYPDLAWLGGDKEAAA